jgi:hypothetical protein
VAQFAFRNAILKLESKKLKRACLARFFFFTYRSPHGNAHRESESSAELSALRRKITELVTENAVPMVQQAIDAVREDGQYQAMKYLFEMIGLYPAAGEEASPAQESLARTLLEQLGPSDTAPDGDVSSVISKPQTAIP